MSTWYHLIFAVHQAEFQVGRIIDTLPLLIEFYTVILLIQSNSISFSDTLRVASKELKTIISAIKFFSIQKACLTLSSWSSFRKNQPRLSRLVDKQIEGKHMLGCVCKNATKSHGQAFRKSKQEKIP